MSLPTSDRDGHERFIKMPDSVAPGLFGLLSSNRDFTSRQSWGKNQFNSSFPAALLCYMGVLGIEPVYLQLGSDLKVQKTYKNSHCSVRITATPSRFAF
jgi:hypothetical protein